MRRSALSTRRALPAVLALGIVSTLTLSACSADGEDTDGGTGAAADCAPSGEASDSVNVEGDLGEAPEVSFDTPLDAESTQRTVVIEGEGSEAAVLGDTVTVSYTLYNGSTGEQIETTGHTEESDRVPFELDESLYLPGIVEALNCSVLGERIVAVVPPEDAFGETGNEAFGVGADDALVFVMDVVEPRDITAEITTVEPGSEGMPSVVYGDDGVPTVTIPDAEPPAELTLAVLSEGDGDVVSEGDSVEVHYTGVNWTTGETFDSSWPGGSPATFATNQVIPGFGAALVGQPVGSQIVVVIPPSYGYGENGNPSAGISGTDTLVFVVDVLGTTGN
ncbi:FKBP-type peptidyl-prolyl cis-trans isomerase [Salinibacterium sp. SYSU T00001]|uniref:FKBP-type peptidyl-prolyl cis-trans isomerase n=1 Tax=Homoserinimonas sedimenticola TaxID=2986805 RepID=UPI002235B5A7|nr:FKBP-type peptidyl-prolyl cis-trans isomerase [Salinibacterium sedimenticola]MCW4384840.1 FKBP-type peptidyl-prolyl cis-trans isomerase [Salinibacterium sedimenticola]